MGNRTTIKEIDYHRNGVSGLGFHVAIAEDTEDGVTRRMVIVRFPADKETGSVVCAVLDIDLLNDNNIRFGENSWRGDHYSDVMDKAINKRNKEIDKKYGIK